MASSMRMEEGLPGSGDVPQAPLQPALIAWLFAAALPAARRRTALAAARPGGPAGVASGAVLRNGAAHRLRAVLAMAVLALLGLVAGCGNGGDGGDGSATPPTAPRVTPSGSYDITVTAAAPSSTRTFTYRLTVE